MADLLQAGEAAMRAAETLLRGVGARAVLLRMPSPAAGGDEAEQMGLAQALSQDVELAPCVFQRDDLLVSGVAVRRVVGSLEFDSAAVLFKTAVGLVVDGVLLEIEGVTPVESQGVAVCYRVRLRAAVVW